MTSVESRPVAPHSEVAERFRFFLDACGLGREAFVEGVDGAVKGKSVFTFLDGTRRPSRALAVLIERTWGFRADFLLEGTGPMWVTPPSAARTDHSGPGGLSRQEHEVVAFMRASPEHARMIEREVGLCRVWVQLFDRTLSVLADLERTATSPDVEELARYPAAVRLAYEECLFLAGHYARLTRLLHDRRVHRLVTRFLERFVDELPAHQLRPVERRDLHDALEPTFVHRASVESAYDESIRALRSTLDSVRRLPLPTEVVRARDHEDERSVLTELSGELRALATKGEMAPAAARRLRRAARTLGGLVDARPAFWASLRAMLDDLLRELDDEIPHVAPQSAEELAAQQRAVADAVLH